MLRSGYNLRAGKQHRVAFDANPSDCTRTDAQKRGTAEDASGLGSPALGWTLASCERATTLRANDRETRVGGT
jgi:hypothetical protein